MVYIIITAMGLALTVYLIREKHTELIHEFASLYTLLELRSTNRILSPYPFIPTHVLYVKILHNIF